MRQIIDIEIIRDDLLKNISEKFSIPYEDLLLELDILNKTRIVRGKYSCDHTFFSRDNELSFYWAGFIAADGCVFKKGESKTLSISLAKRDLNHLVRFKNHINFDGKIGESTTFHSRTNPNWHDSIKRTITVTSATFFDSLKRFNIVPNKTKIYTFPNWLIHHNLVNHFMRGYIDGDGSFFHDKSRGRVCFELRGTFDFLKDFQNVLEKHLTKKSNVIVTTPDSTSKIKYYSKHIVPEIVDFLYRDATIFLQRKYDIAKESKNVTILRKRYNIQPKHSNV